MNSPPTRRQNDSLSDNRRRLQASAARHGLRAHSQATIPSPASRSMLVLTRGPVGTSAFTSVSTRGNRDDPKVFSMTAHRDPPLGG